MPTETQMRAARDLIDPARTEIAASVAKARQSENPEAALGALVDELLDGAEAAFGADHGHSKDAVLAVLRSL